MYLRPWLTRKERQKCRQHIEKERESREREIARNEFIHASCARNIACIQTGSIRRNVRSRLHNRSIGASYGVAKSRVLFRKSLKSRRNGTLARVTGARSISQLAQISILQPAAFNNKAPPSVMQGHNFFNAFIIPVSRQAQFEFPNFVFIVRLVRAETKAVLQCTKQSLGS